MRSTKAVISLKAIQHNLSVVRQLAPHSKIMAVVKANAYGHGIVAVSQSLQSQSSKNIDAIAVACMDEALVLREANITMPLILLEGFFSEDELELAFKHNLQTVVHQNKQIESLKKINNDKKNVKKIKVWLKLDSGMNRLGFSVEDFNQAYQELCELDIVEEVFLMSHLACAGDINSSFNQKQISIFSDSYKNKNCERTMANSAGVIAWPESHLEWVRPGILIYGCSPMNGLEGSQHHLIPAMTLQSQMFAIRNLKKGDCVGYGSDWTTPKDTNIGVVAIGYGDGYPRHIKEGTPVLIEGKKYPIVGKVSMDMLTVDLGQDTQIPLGTKVILWGEGLPVETIAKWADTIPYTLFCGVTSRVAFEWSND